MRAPTSEDDSKGGTICKPSIIFEVRAPGCSYMDAAKDVIRNDRLRKEWFGDTEGHTPQRRQPIIDEDQMLRKFGDRTLDVFKDIVKGVVNADGWFFNSAGRGAPHQLIGDCIETFDALEDTTWVNFASLANPHLFGEDLHDHMVKELRQRSIEIPTRPNAGEKDITLPRDEPEKWPSKTVRYKAPDPSFPKLADLQGSKKDGVMKWLDDQMSKHFKDGHKETHLHPSATHFIFFVRPQPLFLHCLQ